MASMLKLLHCSLLLLAMGCDTIHQNQFVVAEASPGDCAFVATTIVRAAEEAGLEDKTASSNVRSTIAYYSEPVPHFPVHLGGRMVGDSAVVDLMCFHPGWRKPRAYKVAEKALRTQLSEEFGERLKEPRHGERIPIKHERTLWE